MVRDYRPNDAARSLDDQQTMDWIAGWQVIDPAGGSNLVTAGTGDFEYDAAAGDVNAGGTVVTCSQETVDFSADVDANDDRMAVIYRDAAGALQKELGATGTRDPAGDDVRSTHTPPPPSMHDVNGVVLAEVLLPAGASSVGASELRDRRDPVGPDHTVKEIDDTDSPYTTSGEKVILANTANGAVTVTLASADLSLDHPITIINLDGSNAVTVDTEAAETIDPDGDSSKSLTKAGFAVPFSPDGSNWDGGLAAEYESITATNQTFARLSRNADTGVRSNSAYTNAYDTEDKDTLNEVNGSFQFKPVETGEYDVSASVGINATDGDRVSMIVRDVDTPETVINGRRIVAVGATANVTVGIGGTYNLTGGTNYEIQARNFDSDYILKGLNEDSGATIARNINE